MNPQLKPAPYHVIEGIQWTYTGRCACPYCGADMPTVTPEGAEGCRTIEPAPEFIPSFGEST